MGFHVIPAGSTDNPTRRILALHARRYPRLEIGDAVRLLYESEFGPTLPADREQEAEALRKELEQAREERNRPAYTAEAIGNGLSRFHLDPRQLSEEGCDLLSLCMTASQDRNGSMVQLCEKLGLLTGLAWNQAGAAAGRQVEDFLSRWAEEDCPLPEHSPSYVRHYHPHYRLIDRHLAAWFPALQMIHRALETSDQPVVVAVDGRCASGKTVFARHLRRLWPCNVFHMDDYLLPEEDERRTPQRLALPGGQVDCERVEEEVLLPLLRGEAVTVRAFDRRCQTMTAPQTLPARRLNIVEGTYALHPRLSPYSQVRLLFTCDPTVQLERLTRRETPDQLAWDMEHRIPLEEAYLRTVNADTLCDAVIDTSRLPRIV